MNKQGTFGSSSSKPIPVSSSGTHGHASIKSAPSAPVCATPITLLGHGAKVRNVFSILLQQHSDFRTCQIWLSSGVMFVPGVFLGLYNIFVILLSIFLWPYGLSLVYSTLLWQKIKSLYSDYHAVSTAAHKVALAFSLVLVSVLALPFAILSIPLILIGMYLRWLMVNPLLNIGVSFVFLIGVALFVGFVVWVLPVILVVSFIGYVSSLD